MWGPSWHMTYLFCCSVHQTILCACRQTRSRLHGTYLWPNFVSTLADTRDLSGIQSQNVNIGVLTLSQTSPGFYVSTVEVFWSTVEKGEIARNEQFLLYPQCFLSFWRIFLPFWSQNARLQPLTIWTSLKFVVWERVKWKYSYNLWKGLRFIAMYLQYSRKV